MSNKWEKVYRKYLYDADLSYSELGKVMEQFRPKKLYRYMRFDDYWEKNIFDGQVYLSEAANLNDPFDCLVYINHKAYIEHMFQSVCKIFPQIDRGVLRETVKSSINEEIDKQLYNMKKKFRVACFTENNTSPLMWAHYSDSHMGFCLEYDLEKLPKGYRYGILPVIYTDKRYDATNDIVTKAAVPKFVFTNIPEDLYDTNTPMASTKANTKVNIFVYLLIFFLPSSPPSFVNLSKDGIIIATN